MESDGRMANTDAPLAQLTPDERGCNCGASPTHTPPHFLSLTVQTRRLLAPADFQPRGAFANKHVAERAPASAAAAAPCAGASAVTPSRSRSADVAAGGRPCGGQGG